MVNLPVTIAICTTVLFGGIAILFSLREERLQRRLKRTAHYHKEHQYELAILRELQKQLGYTLDMEEVLTILVRSLRSFISYSTASLLLYKDHTLCYKVYADESVSPRFVAEVKRLMCEALSTLRKEQLPLSVAELIEGNLLDEEHQGTLASHFHIPIMQGTQIVGLLTIASTRHKAYEEEEKALLYQLASQTTAALAKLERMLAIERAKLAALIGNVADGVLLLDITKRVLIINPQAKQILGISKDQPTILDILAPLGQVDAFITLIDTVLLDQKVSKPLLLQLGEKYYQLRVAPVFSPLAETGQVKRYQPLLGVSVQLHDVTLEKSLGQMKEDFTNIIVHELRSPLTAIKAASDLVVKQDHQLNADERARLLALVSNQSQKLLDEISIILEAAKMEAGSFMIEKKPGNLASLITTVASSFAELAEEKHITLLVHLMHDLPQTAFDEKYLADAVHNLLANSFKFTPVGGTIRLTAKPHGKRISIAISDTGSGIPKDKQEALFRKFSQIRTPNALTGTGLGLYLVKGIIEAHGGTITLHSEVNHGTTITFTLPITSEKEAIDAVTETAYLPN